MGVTELGMCAGCCITFARGSMTETGSKEVARPRSSDVYRRDGNRVSCNVNDVGSRRKRREWRES